MDILFTECKTVVHLNLLSLKLPMPCDMIKWPDFSALQVLLLELGSKERNWKLGRLLHQLSLISLSIVSDMDVQSSLVTEDGD